MDNGYRHDDLTCKREQDEIPLRTAPKPIPSPFMPLAYF